MFGILSDLADSVENVIDVSLGLLTFNEIGSADKRSISKLIADGIELAIVADMYGTSIDVINKIVED